MHQLNYKKWLIVQCVSILRPIFALCFCFTWNNIILINWSICFFLAIFLSDFIDGRLARHWNVTSRFGSILDPVCDKLSIYMLFYALQTNNLFVLKEDILFNLVVCKDILVIVGGIYTQYKFKKSILTTLGKSTMVFIGLFFCSVVVFEKYSSYFNSLLITNKQGYLTVFYLPWLYYYIAMFSIIFYIHQYIYLLQKMLFTKKN